MTKILVVPISSETTIDAPITYIGVESTVVYGVRRHIKHSLRAETLDYPSFAAVVWFTVNIVR